MQTAYTRGVTIRPLRHGEAAAVQAVFDGLGARSRQLRFGGAKTILAESELAELTRVDGRRHALVAFDGAVAVGIARLVRDLDHPETAEVACAVSDGWQRRGIGRALMERLAADARAAGITRLRAFVHADNAAPLRLMERVTTVVERRLAGAELEIVGLTV